MLIARITTQLAKYPHVLYAKPSNKVYIQLAVPSDKRVVEKERETQNKDQDLKHEMARLWESRKVEVIPLVIATVGMVTKSFKRGSGN